MFEVKRAHRDIGASLDKKITRFERLIGWSLFAAWEFLRGSAHARWHTALSPIITKVDRTLGFRCHYGPVEVSGIGREGKFHRLQKAVHERAKEAAQRLFWSARWAGQSLRRGCGCDHRSAQNLSPVEFICPKRRHAYPPFAWNNSNVRCFASLAASAL